MCAMQDDKDGVSVVPFKGLIGSIWESMEVSCLLWGVLLVMLFLESW